MPVRSRRLRPLVAAALCGTLLATGCSNGAGSNGDRSPSPATSRSTSDHATEQSTGPSTGQSTGQSTGRPTEADDEPSGARGFDRLPATPVGRTLTRALTALSSGPLDQRAYRRLFAPSFRDKVTLQQLNGVAGRAITIRRVRPGKAPNYLSAAGAVEGIGDVVITAAVDVAATGAPLTQLALAADPQPTAPVPDSLGRWSAVDAAVRDLAPRASMLAAEVIDGACRPVHTLRADAAAPLGSTFKLWVLQTVARAVESGRLDWNQRLRVTDAVRTLPSGVLQDTTGRVPISLLDTTALMISLSDNTATDLAIQAVGRQRVQAVASAGDRADPRSMTPLLTVADLMSLRLNDYPRLARRYVAAGTAERRQLLASAAVRNRPTIADAEAWTKPRWAGGPGWQASAADLCNVLADLDALDGKPQSMVSEVLSLNDGGLSLDPGSWRRVWFKGGSEPGVFALAYLAEHDDGRVIAVTMLLADPKQALNEQQVAPAALNAVRAAFQLSAS